VLKSSFPVGWNAEPHARRYSLVTTTLLGDQVCSGRDRTPVLMEHSSSSSNKVIFPHAMGDVRLVELDYICVRYLTNQYRTFKSWQITSSLNLAQGFYFWVNFEICLCFMLSPPHVHTRYKTCSKPCCKVPGQFSTCFYCLTGQFRQFYTI